MRLKTGSPHKWLILLAVGIGTLMSALDGSVVNTILPVIHGYFETDVAIAEWTVVIYLLVVSGLLFSFGRYGDLRGHKNIYILGFIIFVGASIMCGLAQSIGKLLGEVGGHRLVEFGNDSAAPSLR